MKGSPYGAKGSGGYDMKPRASKNFDMSGMKNSDGSDVKPGAPGFFGKLLDPLGLKGKLFGKKGGGKPCPPAGDPKAAAAAAAPAATGAAPVDPAAAAPAAAPAAATPEEVPAPTQMRKSSPTTRRDVYIDGINVGTGKEAREKGMAQEKINKRVEKINAKKNDGKDATRDKHNKTVRYTSGNEPGDKWAEANKADNKKYPNAQVMSRGDDITPRIKRKQLSDALEEKHYGKAYGIEKTKDGYGGKRKINYANPEDNKKSDARIRKGKYAQSTEFGEKGNKSKGDITWMKPGSNFKGYKEGTIKSTSTKKSYEDQLKENSRDKYADENMSHYDKKQLKKINKRDANAKK